MVSLVNSTRLNSPVTTVFFADRFAQLTPTSRQAERAVIAQALGLDVSATVTASEGGEPLRDSGAQVRTVLCARSVLGRMVGYICRRPVLKTVTRSHVCTFVHSDIRDVVRTRWCVECAWSKEMLIPAYSALCTYGHGVIIEAMAPSGAGVCIELPERAAVTVTGGAPPEVRRNGVRCSETEGVGTYDG